MTDFEKDTTERLVRLEVAMANLSAELRGFKAKVATVAAAVGAFVSGLFTYFVR